MPTQRGCVGLLRDILRHVYRFTMKVVVVSAVLEFLPYAVTDLEMMVWRHRHVTGVEQAVDVTPQQ